RPDRLVLPRPEACDRRADVHAAELAFGRVEQLVDLVRHHEIRLERDPAGLAGELLGAVAARSVVDRHTRALGCEGVHACRADSAPTPGHEDAFPGQSRLHGLTLSSRSCAPT